MASRLVRIATAAAARLGDQGVALENARSAATTLAQRRVDRLEVEHYLETRARTGVNSAAMRRQFPRTFSAR